MSRGICREASEQWLARHSSGISQKLSTALSQWHLVSEMMDLEMEMPSDAEDQNQNAGPRSKGATKVRPISLGVRSYDLAAFVDAKNKIQEWENHLEEAAARAGTTLSQVLASPDLLRVWQDAWYEAQQETIDPMTCQSSQKTGSDRVGFWYAVQRVNGRLERRYVGHDLPPSARSEPTAHARRGVVFVDKLQALMESQGLSPR